MKERREQGGGGSKGGRDEMGHKSKHVTVPASRVKVFSSHLHSSLAERRWTLFANPYIYL